MRLLRYSLLLLFILSIAPIIGFPRLKQLVTKSSKLLPFVTAIQALDFPAQLTLKSHDNNELSVILMARNHEFIQFIRTRDQADFIYPIKQLDSVSQQLVLQYPDSGIKNADAYLKNKSISLEQVVIESSRERVVKLEQQIKELAYKKITATEKATARGITNEIDQLQLEKAELLQDIIRRNPNAIPSEETNEVDPTTSPVGTMKQSIHSLLRSPEVQQMLQLKKDPTSD